MCRPFYVTAVRQIIQSESNPKISSQSMQEIALGLFRVCLPCSWYSCWKKLRRTKIPRGGDKLILNGHAYIVRTKKTGIWIRWTCVNNKRLRCPGSLTTDDPANNPHSFKLHLPACQPNNEAMEVQRFRSSLREQARLSVGGANTSGKAVYSYLYLWF